MPIAKQRRGTKWVVYNKETGKVYGRHPNSMKANAQMKAMASKGVDMTGKDEKESPKEAATPGEEETELKKGIKDEQEHLKSVHGNQTTIKNLALDHLKKNPHYYTDLQKAGL